MLKEGSLPVPRFTFDFSRETPACACPGPLSLRRTRERRIVSLAYGRFVAVERTGFCSGHPAGPEVRSSELAKLVAPGARHAYDLLVRVGMAHFLECRQYAEIQTELSARHAIGIPVRTLGHLARKFVAYIQVVHRESIPLLRADMIRRGGYILHIDGTCEEGSWVLLVCMDSMSGQVLDSRKIASESTREVRGVLEKVHEEWGTPLAAVHDLRASLLTAVGEEFPGVRQFVCHFHLAADVGKDILGGGVDRLRRLFRQSRLRPKLGVLARSLRPFAVEAEGAGHVLTGLVETLPREGEGTVIPEAQALGAIHGLVSWILAFSRAGRGYGFPFELPYLELYERVVAVHDTLAGITAGSPDRTGRVAEELGQLRRILASAIKGEHAAEFARAVAELRRDGKIFARFRSALRICPEEGKHRRNDEGAPPTLDPERHRLILKHFRSTLEWRAKRDEGAARACQIVIDHLDKYEPYLFGHRLREEPGEIVAPRTNNRQESEFRRVKRGCRRLHGRGHLARDVDEMPAGTMLLRNLRNPGYCRTVFGGTGEEKIAARFSAVDPALPAGIMREWKKDRSTTRLPRKLERMKDLPARIAPLVAAAARASHLPA